MHNWVSVLKCFFVSWSSSESHLQIDHWFQKNTLPYQLKNLYWSFQTISISCLKNLMLFYSCSTVPLQKQKRFQKWLCSWPQVSLTALGMDTVCLTENLKKMSGAMKQEVKYERNQAYLLFCCAHTQNSVLENFNKSVFLYSLSSVLGRSHCATT